MLSFRVNFPITIMVSAAARPALRRAVPTLLHNAESRILSRSFSSTLRTSSQQQQQPSQSPRTPEYAIPDPSRPTHFGFETVTEGEKVHRVAEVFTSVAEDYDRMNDLMSFGWHRVWK